MLKKNKLGRNGPDIGCLGYGACVLEGYYGPAEEKQGIDTIHCALDHGMTMIDTADSYGVGHNEILVGKAIKNRRADAFIATKFGIVFESGQSGTDYPNSWDISLAINGSDAYTKRAIDQSLKRLNVDEIDLWYLHYPDLSMPIEETVSAMADTVKAGKVRYLGLSNVTAEQVRRAHSVYPITAVQYEYSLWRSEAERELLPTLRDLGIALVPWSPLGSGFLTGQVDDGVSGTTREVMTRFQGENYQMNQQRFAPFMTMAEDLGVTPAQLALAWLLHKGDDIFPIPGTRKAERVLENIQAAEIVLDAATMEKIDVFSAPGLAAGRNFI